MVPGAERSPDRRPSNEQTNAEADGGDEFGFDDEALYAVVRTAVKDALLDVIGTVLLVGIGVVLVIAGGSTMIQGASLVGIAVGVWLVAVGLYLAATALELIPSVREWL